MNTIAMRGEFCVEMATAKTGNGNAEMLTEQTTHKGNYGQRPACRMGDAGFALVELLVALAILTLSLGIMFEVMSSVTRTLGRAEELVEAVAVAQSLLDKVGREIPLKLGEVTGKAENELTWRMKIESFGDEADRKAWSIAAYAVSAEVHSRKQLIALRTLRLGPKTKQ
ncbi:PulJ/GspJ family protein [Hyphomicrobium sp.]|uniref:PulJ/GspJ family protein n=1 Tax=Hyphomicrobium sp. TaxID=82 RepID=UPI003F72E766